MLSSHSPPIQSFFSHFNFPLNPLSRHSFHITQILIKYCRHSVSLTLCLSFIQSISLTWTRTRRRRRLFSIDTRKTTNHAINFMFDSFFLVLFLQNILKEGLILIQSHHAWWGKWVCVNDKFSLFVFIISRHVHHMNHEEGGKKFNFSRL